MPPSERAPPPRSGRALAVTGRAGPPAEQERRAGCGKTVRAIAGLAQCKKPTTRSCAARTSVQAQYQQLSGRADFRLVGRWFERTWPLASPSGRRAPWGRVEARSRSRRFRQRERKTADEAAGRSLRGG